MTLSLLNQFKNKIKFPQVVNPLNGRQNSVSNGYVHTRYGTAVKVVRTQRKKTLSVKVHANAVSVLVPQHTSLLHIATIVEEKSDWIEKKLRQLKSQLTIKKHDYIEGEMFLYLGVTKLLKIVTDVNRCIYMDDSNIYVCSNRRPSVNTVKTRLKKWYQQQAQLYLAKRSKYFAEVIGVKPRLITTRTYSARWGCCSNRKEITYNWQLIMAPEIIIDYVIVHELCHIKEHNHSKDFWELVEGVLADYKERKRWLDVNGRSLEF